MFLLRSVSMSDTKDLYHLSQLVLFINLPPDEAIIQKKVESSVRAFQKPDKRFWKNYYLFVIEDLNTNQVVGVSMIHAQHGTEEEPHYFFKVGQEHKFSRTINTGFIHGTLKLGLDTDGPTEIGGLVIDPSFRKTPHKIGKQISFVRFLYMSIFPDRFKTMIHSELMPPLDKHGNSPLWEAIGRRFLNMGYQEADELSRSNKEFILNLFPSDTIYETLLPLEARNAIGKVGIDTEPVKKMLAGIGFKYMDEVDPFDGGPHYRARLEDISLIKEKEQGYLNINKKLDEQNARQALITINHGSHDFAATMALVNVNGDEVVIEESVRNYFNLKEKELTHLIYLD
ncbi:MAG: arginine N-succinyltransferase [Bacteriovoracaceae bacterium]